MLPHVADGTMVRYLIDGYKADPDRYRRGLHDALEASSGVGADITEEYSDAGAEQGLSTSLPGSPLVGAPEEESKVSIVLRYDRDTGTPVLLHLPSLDPSYQGVLGNTCVQLDPWGLVPNPDLARKQDAKLASDMRGILKLYARQDHPGPAPSKTGIVRVSHYVFGVPRRSSYSTWTEAMALEDFVRGLQMASQPVTTPLPIVRGAMLAFMVQVTDAIEYFTDETNRESGALRDTDEPPAPGQFARGWPVTPSYIGNTFDVDHFVESEYVIAAAPEAEATAGEGEKQQRVKTKGRSGNQPPSKKGRKK